MIKMILALITSFGISYLSTPLAMKLAHKIGAIDVPKDNRRVHKEPIPRLGGLAIFLGFIITSMIFVDINKKMIGIFLGALIIVIIGIIDDVKEIKAKVKLGVQILAAVIVVIFGVQIEWVTNPFDTIDRTFQLAAVIGIPVTIFWIVGATNTVNLIDGLDGLAAGVSAIAATTLSFVSFINHQQTYAVLLLALAGAAIGFLPYNFNPAKIFMGDTGSLFLGFVLSVIAIEAAIKSAAALAIAIPILAIGLPIFDTTFAIIRRASSGKPIMQADKGHLHHRLLNKGLTQKQTVLILYAISMVLGISAILISELRFYNSVIILFLDFMLMYYGIIRLKLLSSDEAE